MKIAFYKAKGNIFDKLIRWWTKEPYSHCELVFSDGMFFSADARSGKVRYKQIEQDITKWDFVDLNIDTFGENHIRRWCNCKDGLLYDWLGLLLSHAINIGVEDPDRYFCSEICCKAIQLEGLAKGYKASSLNPGELYRIVS